MRIIHQLIFNGWKQSKILEKKENKTGKEVKERQYERKEERKISLNILFAFIIIIIMVSQSFSLILLLL